MENNENNFNNSVNNESNVQENVNEEVQKNSNKGKGLTIVLVVIVIVLLLAIGICIGLAVSNKETKIINNSQENFEKKEEKTSKKIDETKDWVYDAEYGKDKKNKSIDIYESDKNLIVPFININSDDGNKVNKEIEKLYNEAYETFGAREEGTNSLNILEYEYYINGNILSILIKKDKVVLQGDGIIRYITYNFNLDTLKLATLEETIKECGFNSENEVKEKLQIAIKNLGGESSIFEGTDWDKERFFINENGKLCVIILPNEGYAEVVLEIDKNAELNNKTNNVTTPNTNNNQAEYVTILNSINESNFKIMEIDKLTGNIAKVTDYNVAKKIINEVKNYKLEEKDAGYFQEMNHITINYNNTNIYFHYNDNIFAISKGGENENDQYKCWISYSNDTTGLQKIISENVNFETRQIIKKLSPSGWAGSSMQEIRLYDNGDVYQVTYNGEGNTEQNIISSELIAKNADTIEEVMSGQAVEGITVKGKNLEIVEPNVCQWISFKKD